MLYYTSSKHYQTHSAIRTDADISNGKTSADTSYRNRPMEFVSSVRWKMKKHVRLFSLLIPINVLRPREVFVIVNSSEHQRDRRAI